MNYTDLVNDIETLSTYVSDGYTKAVLRRAADAIGTLVSYMGEYKAAYIAEHDARIADYKTDKDRQAVEAWENVQKRLRQEEGTE